MLDSHTGSSKQIRLADAFVLIYCKWSWGSPPFFFAPLCPLLEPLRILIVCPVVLLSLQPSLKAAKLHRFSTIVGLLSLISYQNVRQVILTTRSLLRVMVPRACPALEGT